MADLFTPFKLSDLQLANRVVMPPMTRSRAPDDIPTASMVTYYTQRASAGLIIAEGSPVSREGQGYLYNPGIFLPEQIEGWRRVTESVHQAGGKIILQLWHVGRISHTSIQHNHLAPVSSTNRLAEGVMAFGFNEAGEPDFVQSSVPRSLDTSEIKRVVSDFRQAAVNAVEAGFDGVELHAANGYLFDQFMNPFINDRQDEYGAQSFTNRMRFTLEVVDAVSDAIGPQRVGMRLSPFGVINGVSVPDDEEAIFLELGKELAQRNISFIHVMDQTGFFNTPEGVKPTSDLIKELFIKWRSVATDVALMMDGSMNLLRANHLIRTGVVDLVGFGQAYIANPDLVLRLQNGYPLNVADRATYYTGGDTGYIDYPFYAKKEA